MDKRGQITIFIILAIVVIAAVGIYFAVSGNLDKVKSSSLDTRQIKGFVESCIGEIGKDAIYEVGQRGGYIFAPSLSTEEKIPYYLYEGKNYLPSQEKLEKSLSKYIEDFLFVCLNNFEDFPDYAISKGKISCETDFTNNSVEFNVNYPLVISKNNQTSKIENFKTIEVSSFEQSFYSAQQIIENIVKENGLCLTCISNILEKTDFRIEISPVSEGGNFISIINDNEKIRGLPLKYTFAIKLEDEK